MDIKIKNVNKIVEKKVERKAPEVVEIAQTFQSIHKKTYSKFSTILFGFMSASVMCYIFMISSSIFYAVKMSQFTFKGENMTATVATSSETYELAVKSSTGRISYINKNSDTSISLK